MRRELKNYITIYALILEEGKVYVGQSNRPEQRISAHFKGRGSAWTKKYMPVSIICQEKLYTKYWRDALEVEKRLTIKLMNKYGWKNVRGACWTQVNLSKKPKELKSG